MKSFKDFLYDKNDILISLVILVLAALLIVWRMGVIMNFPQTLAESTGTTDTTAETAVPTVPDTNTDTKTDTPATPESASIWADGMLSKAVTVKVQGGSATTAVQSLIDAELFKNYEEYASICKAAGYTPENIKATTFTFEVGCTQTDIAKRVTQ